MVSRRVYLIILMLFATAFIMFMSVGISSNIITDKVMMNQNNKDLPIRDDARQTLHSFNLAIPLNNEYSNNKLALAIIAQDEDDNDMKLLIEWCQYQKYLYKIYTLLPSIEEIEDYAMILFGNIKLSESDVDILYTYADMGKTMIFTKLPDYKLIKSNQKLADFFGIAATLSEKVIADGFKIFAGFLIGGERVYQKGDFYGDKDDTQISLPYYKLSPGYEVYAVGLFDDQKEIGIENKDLPPILWRTKTKSSFVFVNVSDIFSGPNLLGILTGFMAREKECYLYPVVNAQTISVVDYPYFSNENKTILEGIYSRSAEHLARDILWPNIIRILKNFGSSYNFFAASQLDYDDDYGSSIDYLEFYFREVHQLPCNIGLSLNQISKADLNNIIDENSKFFKQHIPDYQFRALHLIEFDEDEIKEKLDHELLKNISLIMSDYKQGDRLIELIDDYILSVKFNLYGDRHETLDNLFMNSIENALGMCNMKVDISPVIFPKDTYDQWNNLSLIWSRQNTYFKDYYYFDMVSISEMEKRVRRFLDLDFTYEYNVNDINIQISNFDEEAYFILCIYDKTIDYVLNGEANEISANTYLIKATDINVKVGLKDLNILDKPKKNKTIQSYP